MCMEQASDSTEATVIPAMIVGGGPVGLTLSIELSRWGVDHVLVNEGVDTSRHPKCNTTNARSMEHFRRLGLARDIRFGGLADDYPLDIVYLTRLSQPEIARVRFPTPKEAGAGVAGDLRWNTPEPQHRISQIFLEEILLDHARRSADADVRFGERLIDFTDRGPFVEAVIEHVATGGKRTVRTRWLIGCDGGRSVVRKASGIAFSGEDQTSRAMFGGRMLATFYRSRDLGDMLRGREGFMYWTLNADVRAVTVAIDGTSRFLTHVQYPSDAAPSDLDPTDIVRRTAGADIDVEILSSANWNAGFRLVADRFVKGRIVLAGDSAHLFTPTGGFGMNTGIDDVANLAWKLAGDALGWGGPRLIPSYNDERRPIAFRNTDAAAGIADMLGRIEIPQGIEDDGPAGSAARASIANRIGGISNQEFQTVGVQLGARYDRSPIVIGDQTPPPVDLPTVYVPTARPGSRLPHFRLDDGAAVFDRLGCGFTLIAAGAGLTTDHLLAAASGAGIPLAVLEVAEGEIERLGARLVLVRPDQHVAWRGEELPDNCAEMLAIVSGNAQNKETLSIG